MQHNTSTLHDVHTGKHVALKVAKRPGMEAEMLLPVDDKADAGGSSKSDKKTGSASKKKGALAAKNSNVINVFTVASGHMYERLQKIMILSVIKNTKSKCAVPLH